MVLVITRKLLRMFAWAAVRIIICAIENFLRLDTDYLSTMTYYVALPVCNIANNRMDRSCLLLFFLIIMHHW
jgi:hypothetical protein